MQAFIGATLLTSKETQTMPLQRGWLERSDRSNLIPSGGVRERRLRAAFSCHGLSLGRRTSRAQ